MDLKEEVRRRIAELTRFAYERGYRDGAQSALSEIESATAEDLAGHMKDSPTALAAIPAVKQRAGKTPAKAKPSAAKRTSPAKPSKAKSAKAKPSGDAPSSDEPKTTSESKSAIVRAALMALIDSKGEARRDELLSAARAQNPTITSQDVSNGLRMLSKRAEIRLDPQDSTRLLPA